MTCTETEKLQIQSLSKVLCAPVGGVGAAVSSAQPPASFFATTHAAATVSTTTTPVLVAPTPAPTVSGNASDLSSYPVCAQQCFNKTVSRLSLTPDQITDPSVICGPELRSLTAACEAVSCDALDYQQDTRLGQVFCGPLYKDNTSLSATVAAAIGSATHAAAAAAAAASTGFTPSSANNASVTGAAGAPPPTPSAFTGGASGCFSVWTTTSGSSMTGFLLLGSSLGIVVMVFGVY
ncbi:MAG: hypothetical protein Q9191_001543 [Dirinaria sp. TL-2023a]